MLIGVRSCPTGRDTKTKQDKTSTQSTQDPISGSQDLQMKQTERKKIDISIIFHVKGNTVEPQCKNLC